MHTLVVEALWDERLVEVPEPQFEERGRRVRVADVGRCLPTVDLHFERVHGVDVAGDPDVMERKL